MGIIQKDGFNFFDGLISDYIVVEENRIRDYVDYICKHSIRAVAIIDIYFRKNNLDFLKECIFIEKINVSSSFIEDYSGLASLKKLKELSLEEPKDRVNLSMFKQLEILSVGLNKNIIGIEESSSLKVLHLWKYKPKSKSLEELSELTNLEELVLTQSQITSLKGLNNFSRLKKLEMNYNSKLENIDEAGKAQNELKELVIESCKSIQNYACLNLLKELIKLTIYNCSDIPSINFVKDLPKLKFFVFMGSNVIDGDISPCIGLEYVAFTDKKHFSHKMKDFSK